MNTKIRLHTFVVQQSQEIWLANSYKIWLTITPTKFDKQILLETHIHASKYATKSKRHAQSVSSANLFFSAPNNQIHNV